MLALKGIWQYRHGPLAVCWTGWMLPVAGPLPPWSWHVHLVWDLTCSLFSPLHSYFLWTRWGHVTSEHMRGLYWVLSTPLHVRHLGRLSLSWGATGVAVTFGWGALAAISSISSTFARYRFLALPHRTSTSSPARTWAAQVCPGFIFEVRPSGHSTCRDLIWVMDVGPGFASTSPHRIILAWGSMPPPRVEKIGLAWVWAEQRSCRKHSGSSSSRLCSRLRPGEEGSTFDGEPWCRAFGDYGL